MQNSPNYPACDRSCGVSDGKAQCHHIASRRAAVTASAGPTDDDHVRVVSCVIVQPLPIHSCWDKLTLQDNC